MLNDHGDGDTVEKGYFVFEIEEIEKSKDLRLPEPNFLDSFSKDSYCGYMDVSLELEQPFSVTDGIERRLTPDLARMHRFTGEKIMLNMYMIEDAGRRKLLIPGSSLKGAFRTYFEAVYGFDLAEKIFGSTNGASTVYFSDVLIESETILRPYPEQFGRESSRGSGTTGSIRLYKRQPSQEYSRRESECLYVVMALREGGEIRTRVVFKAIPKTYLFVLSVFFNSVRIFKEFYVHLKIGRGKNVGMGLILPTLESIMYLDLQSDPPQYKAFDLRKVVREMMQDQEVIHVVSHLKRRLRMIVEQTLNRGDGA
ncbi:RAMP superfamily CRISPR-associated protein [Pseudothermotoga sp.]